jgi:hypothetical protein
MSVAHQDESMMNERIKDLKLAASFVKSIETADHTVNLEIQQVAQHIEGLAYQLYERRVNAAEEHHPRQKTA